MQVRDCVIGPMGSKRHRMAARGAHIVAVALIAVYVAAHASCSRGVSKHYRAGETLYVLADRGLALREAPGTDAKVLSTAARGASVVVESVPFFQRARREGTVRGYWVAVRVDGRRGYLFDAFLCRVPPYRAGEGRDAFLTRAFGAHTTEERENDETTTVERRYANGVRVVITRSGIDCVEKVEYLVPAIRIETAFHLFRPLLSGLGSIDAFPDRTQVLDLSNDRDGSEQLNIVVRTDGEEVRGVEFMPDGIAYTCAIARHGDGVRVEECFND